MVALESFEALLGDLDFGSGASMGILGTGILARFLPVLVQKALPPVRSLLFPALVLPDILFHDTHVAGSFSLSCASFLQAFPETPALGFDLRDFVEHGNVDGDSSVSVRD